MREIVLITETYPYSGAKEGSFLDPEMRALEKQPDFQSGAIRVWVAPLKIEGAKVGGLPAGVRLVENLTGKRQGRLIEIARAVFKLMFWKQVFIRIFDRRANTPILSDFKSVINWVVYYCKAKNGLKEIIESDKNSKWCVYTYWFNGATSAAIDVAAEKSERMIKVVTRAHGHDLYSHVYWKPRRRFDISRVNGLFPVSEKGLEELNKISRSERAETYYVGVDRFLFDAQKEEAEEKFRILSCSYMAPVKRVPLLCKGVIALAQRNPVHKVRWTHFGGGEEEHIVHASLKGAPSNLVVDLMGSVENKTIRELFHKKQWTVFVNVSTSEGVPVALMEALEAGIPVMATNVGGNPEIVNDSVGILLSPNPSTDEIAGGIEAVSHDFARLSANAHKQWEEKFNAEVNHSGFYKNIIALLN